jgi:hypothetical protein
MVSRSGSRRPDSEDLREDDENPGQSWPVSSFATLCIKAMAGSADDTVRLVCGSDREAQEPRPKTHGMRRNWRMPRDEETRGVWTAKRQVGPEAPTRRSAPPADRIKTAKGRTESHERRRAVTTPGQVAITARTAGPVRRRKTSPNE